MEGLTTQTLESEGGFLFTTKEMLRRKLIRLASDERLRHELGNNLRRYLDTVVSWDVVTGQYDEAYTLAREAVQSGKPVELPAEF
jgi:glycosyltransferase involved in cell wall biosynthesis